MAAKKKGSKRAAKPVRKRPAKAAASARGKASARPAKPVGESLDLSPEELAKLNQAELRKLERRKFLTATEFLRLRELSGRKISKKNLYDTYLGKDASHPVDAGWVKRLNGHKRYHWEKLGALIDQVQNEVEPGASSEIARRRQLAEAQIKEHKAELLRMELEAKSGDYLSKEEIRGLIGPAWASVETASRNMANALPDLLAGRSKKEMMAIIEREHCSMFQSLAEAFQKL